MEVLALVLALVSIGLAAATLGVVVALYARQD